MMFITVNINEKSIEHLKRFDRRLKNIKYAI